MNRLTLRLAEANVLRADAAIEKYSAERLREGEDFLGEDRQRELLSATLHEARAELLLAQADFVTHDVDADRVMHLRSWLKEQWRNNQSDDAEVRIQDVMDILDGQETP